MSPQEVTDGLADAYALIAHLTATVREQAEQIKALGAMVRTNHAPSTMLLSGLLRLYDDGALRSMSTSSRRSLLSVYPPALAHFGERAADSITRADWIHYRDHVRAKQTTVRKGPPTPYTLNQELKRWRAVYHWGAVEEHVTRNPLAAVRPLRAKTHRHTRPEAAEIAKVLAACDDRLRAFVVVAARTGMRASEVRTLEWKNVDLERARIRIPWHVTKTRQERIVPLTGDAVAALQALCPPGEPGTRYVFESPRKPGRPLVSSTLWLAFRTTVDKLGLEAAHDDVRVRYHDLRHSFTSWAAGLVPLPVAMAISGHKDLRSASRYIQVTEGQMERAQQELNDDVKRQAEGSAA